MNEDPIADEIERLCRIQTYIALMGRSVGFYWFQLSTEARSAVMDQVDGSAGLDQYIVEWATEFDEMWEVRGKIIDNHSQADFPDQIAQFADSKIKSLVAEARLTQ